MAVTNDDYELPLYITPVAKDMAAYLGVTPGSLTSMASRWRRHGKEAKKKPVKLVTLTDREIDEA